MMNAGKKDENYERIRPYLSADDDAWLSALLATHRDVSDEALRGQARAESPQQMLYWMKPEPGCYPHDSDFDVVLDIQRRLPSYGWPDPREWQLEAV